MKPALLSVLLILAAPPSVEAQGPRPSPETARLWAPVQVPQSADYDTGFRAGADRAEEVSTAGRMLGGVAWGLGLGIFGIPLAYFTVGDPDLPSAEIGRLSDRPSEYQQGYAEGYSARLKKRKQGAALGGSIAGTALWLLIVVAANSGS